MWWVSHLSLIGAAGLLHSLPGNGRSWLSLHEPPVIVDLRPPEDFCSGHLEAAANIPLSDLRQRLFELPPPGEWPLGLIGGEAELEEARALLEPKGWTPQMINLSDSAAIAKLGYVTRGPSEAQAWRPNSFLAAVFRSIGTLPHEDEPGAVLDLGCGSGRDAVYLAKELQRRGCKWLVTGIDNHEAALQRGRELAESNHIETTSCSFVNADLRRGGLDETLGAAGLPLRLVHGCRFLDVDLLCRIPQLLAPDGLFVWSTFQDPSDDSRPLAPPFRTSRRLRRGQLAAMLGEDSRGNGGLEVLCDVEGELLTRGEWVPASFFVARRRST